MSFLDSLLTGLGKVTEFAGKALLINGWYDTLRNEGIQMVQIKIRNFLRTASEEDKNSIKELLKEEVRYYDLGSYDRKVMTQLYEIYIDQLG
jgi:hypothetical protein